MTGLCAASHKKQSEGVPSGEDAEEHDEQKPADGLHNFNHDANVGSCALKRLRALKVLETMRDVW